MSCHWPHYITKTALIHFQKSKPFKRYKGFNQNVLKMVAEHIPFHYIVYDDHLPRPIARMIVKHALYQYCNKSVIIVLINSLDIIIIVLCVFLECFKREINKCLGHLNSLVLTHLSTPDLLKFGILLPQTLDPSSIVH